MAQKRTNYARIKAWGETMSIECEGALLGCMEQMLLLMPTQSRQKAIRYLQAVVDKQAVTQERT